MQATPFSPEAEAMHVGAVDFEAAREAMNSPEVREFFNVESAAARVSADFRAARAAHAFKSDTLD